MESTTQGGFGGNWLRTRESSGERWRLTTQGGFWGRVVDNIGKVRVG